MAERELRIKVCLLGNPAVGKTSLVRRFVSGQYDDKYLSTVGVKVSRKSVKVTTDDGCENDVQFLLWDILGQQEFETLHRTSYQGAQAALIVCDLTRKKTLDDTDQWVKSLFRVTGPVPLVFLGNKRDLPNPEFSIHELGSISGKYNSPSLLTSAKTGDNVEKAFALMGQGVCELI